MSGYKGVSWNKSCKLWQARIKIADKERSLGYYFDKISAACAYDRAAIKHFGEFAKTNFPLEDYAISIASEPVKELFAGLFANRKGT
jgi:hypothetical protein